MTPRTSNARRQARLPARAIATGRKAPAEGRKAPHRARRQMMLVTTVRRACTISGSRVNRCNIGSNHSSQFRHRAETLFHGPTPFANGACDAIFRVEIPFRFCFCLIGLAGFGELLPHGNRLRGDTAERAIHLLCNETNC
jgi:hypothetical protein